MSLHDAVVVNCKEGATYYRYTQREFKLKFSTLSKAFEVEFDENCKNLTYKKINIIIKFLMAYCSMS